MGSEGSHSTQNDTPFTPSVKLGKKERKRLALEAKVEELKAQNNKTAMKNEVLQEQYEKLFGMLHEARQTQTHEPVTPVDVNHHLGAPQHGWLPSFNIGIPDEGRATHQSAVQHETSLNPAVSTRSRRSEGRHLLAEGVEGSKAVYRDCRDFVKQRRENPIHISSKINDPRVSEKFGPLPRPRPAVHIGNEQQVSEEYEGTGDSEVFRQTRPRSQYGESQERSRVLNQTFLLPTLCKYPSLPS